MENSNKYRKPPLRRTRDSFIDDKNLQEQPRYDLGKNRHRQVRRDKDKTKSLGITLYDIDFAIKSFIDQKIQLKVEDNGQTISIPILYANSEKWASIQKDGFLKDKKGKTLAPLITFRRSSVTMKNELRRNKVANQYQLGYIMQQRYNKLTPYDKFSTLYQNKKSMEYFLTPIPDYVDVSYDFIIWCEYQNQLNYVIENFIYFGGQSFGERNFFKFSTFLDSISIEDSNTTGQDRLVRASFQLTVHGYLLPKDIAAETTTKRIVTPNRVEFSDRSVGSSFFNDDFIDRPEPPIGPKRITSPKEATYKSLNPDTENVTDAIERKIQNEIDQQPLPTQTIPSNAGNNISNIASGIGGISSSPDISPIGGVGGYGSIAGNLNSNDPQPPGDEWIQSYNDVRRIIEAGNIQSAMGTGGFGIGSIGGDPSASPNQSSENI